MKATLLKQRRTRRRRMSVRNRLRQRSSLPRLSVTRSLKHISAQVIDDGQGRTLCAVSSTARSMSDQLTGKSKTDCAAIIGAEIGQKALAAGVERVVFDRGPCKYHGRIKALADAAREAGLKF